MKKVILTAAIALSVLFGISTTTYAATGSKEEVSTVLTDVSNISEIEVHGNVQVYLTSASDDKVKVYNNYYADNALVQEESGTLRITSYSAEKLVVWVAAKDLSSVSAYDNVEVKSFGNLSNIEFNVDLHNNASAKLDLDAFSANVTVADHAKIDLSGAANEYTLTHNIASSVNNYNFKADHFTDNKIIIPTVKNDDTLVDL